MRIAYLPVLVLFAAFSGCSDDAGQDDVAAPGSSAAKDEAAPQALSRTPAPDGARVFFITPTDGETVSSPVTVVFGIEGMSVAPAGDDTPHSGHHHLLIDTGLPELGMPIPADDRHIHFGDGSTETEIALEPGEHTLQLLLGDHRHIPHDPPLVSGQITIVVE
jgi:hypothetical protein